MNQVSVFSHRPLDFALPEYHARILGLRSPTIAEALLSTPHLRPDLDARLENLLGEPEDPPAAELAVCLGILDADLDRLDALSRVVAVLVHAPSLALATDGAVLRLVVAHAGRRSIVKHLRDPESPAFECLPHTLYVTQELLDLYTHQIGRYLLGLIPPRLFQRMLLRFPEGALTQPDSLAARPTDRAALLNLTRIALSILDLSEDEPDGGGAGHETH